MKKKFFSIRAFSIIEISIVVLIIGILIAGTIEGKKLIRESHLTTARSLTQNSPVIDTAGLIFWIEPVLEESFQTSDPENLTKVGAWKDVNSQRNEHINLTQDDNSRRPTYIASAINGLPALKFDGDDDFLEADISNTPIQTPSLTIIAVTQTDSNGAAQLLSTKRIASGWEFGKIGNDKLAFKDYAGGSNFNFDYAFNKKPQILIFTYIQTDGQNQATLYNNGALVGAGLQGTSKDSSTVLYLGTKQGYSQFWDGYVAEIIIFNRLLKQPERQNIEDYLSKKYDIEVNCN